MASNYLVSYRPLTFNAYGRAAVHKHGLLPFVDGSCRREPDFESDYPSITAICRGSMFAPRLKPGNRVVYITVKEAYEGLRVKHWRAVAILEVLHRFETHSDAEKWYKDHGLKVPNNCLVPGNDPKPFEQTIGFFDKTNNEFRFNPKLLRFRDDRYWKRVRNCGVFLICKTLRLALANPPIVTREAAAVNLSTQRLPNTYNPREIADADVAWFESLFAEPHIMS
jgi:hypothetical protein